MPIYIIVSFEVTLLQAWKSVALQHIIISMNCVLITNNKSNRGCFNMFLVHCVSHYKLQNMIAVYS